MIRNATPADFERLLELNHTWEHVLSPWTRADLERLHRQAAYHRVVDRDGQVTAFLLALREGVDYGSPNYRWFSSRYPQFLYIDRVVVDGSHQQRGLGAALYEDLASFARATQVTHLTCEYDVEPPNPASAAFHARMGFLEIDQQVLYDGRKRVSMQARRLD